MRKRHFTFDNQCSRKYHLNESFFEKIDCQEKAYFLGFIFADGSVSKTSKMNSLRIHLHPQDCDILNKFKNLLGSNAPIIFDKKGYVHFSVFSKKLTDDLILLGAVPAKTFKIRFPFQIIPPELYRHFIRGYFDGDGCFTRNPRQHSSVKFSITSNNFFVKELQNILVKRLGLNQVKLIKCKSDGIESLCYGGRNNFIKFYNFIYEGACIFLERKKEKADKFILDSSFVNQKPYTLISPSGERFNDFTFKQIQSMGGPCKGSVYKMLKSKGSCKNWKVEIPEKMVASDLGLPYDK